MMTFTPIRRLLEIHATSDLRIESIGDRPKTQRFSAEFRRRPFGSNTPDG